MKKKWLAIFVTISCGFVACSDGSDDILDNTPENQYTIDDNIKYLSSEFGRNLSGEMTHQY